MVTSLGPFQTYEAATDFKAVLTNNGTSFTSITCGSLGQQFTVDWGNGSPVSYTAATGSHAVTGTVIVESVNDPDSFLVSATTSVLTAVVTGAGSLTSLRQAFYNHTLITSITIDDTSSVTDFYRAYRATAITAFPSTNFNAATTLQETFYGTPIVTVPSFTVGTALTTVLSAWASCTSLTTFPAIDFKNCADFEKAWRTCSALTTFGQPTYAAASSWNDAFNAAWSSSSTFPALDFSTAIGDSDFFLQGAGMLAIATGVKFNLGGSFNAFEGCPNLVTVNDVDFTGTTALQDAFRDCNALTSVGDITAPDCTDFSGMLASNPLMETVGAIVSTAGTDFGQMFRNASVLTTIDAIDTTATAGVSSLMFSGCPLLTSPDSATQSDLADSDGADFN